MPPEIQASTPDDLPELGRFLLEGFHAPDDSAFASSEVLRWKYFEPIGGEAGDLPRSYLARDGGTGRVVGHVGVWPGRFRGVGLPPGGVSTIHMIDWLADRSASGVGATLMRRAHRSIDTQYVLGGSDAARRVIGRGGYDLVASVPMFRRVLRAGYRWRDPGPGPLGRALRAARDAATLLTTRVPPPPIRIELRPVEEFGPEIEPILASYEGLAVFASRGPDSLNHLLRYPRGGMTGWHLLLDGRLRGLALLAVVPRPGRVLVGRIVELMLDDPEERAWAGAIHALTGELEGRRADVATTFAGTEWAARALRASGYGSSQAIDFRLRDRSNLIPPGSTFHLTMTDADYAYT
jgi:hypothetical protein